MNKRIKDLMGQAKFMAEESINRQISVNAELNAFAEKFAELIVQDCIEIVEPCKCGCCDGEPEGIITGTIIAQIKEHFGVEEPPINAVDRILRTVRTRQS